MVEILVVLDGARRERALRLHDGLDLVAAAFMVDWLAGEPETPVNEFGASGWRVPVRAEVADWLEQSTAEERREYAQELMTTGEVGFGSELESVVGLLEGLAELAATARHEGGRLMLTAYEV